MRLFDLPQAKHFCSKPGNGTQGITQSLQAFHAGLTGVTRLKEGSTAFEIHRVNLVDSAERWLVYALALYRRSFDMLVPISAPWAQVTLYYSSFFAANAILGMFGGWVGGPVTGDVAVDVESGAVGAQELRIVRRFKSPNGATGSHRKFWDTFYDAVSNISAWLPASMSSALAPVLGDVAWQIQMRNSLNYDMHHAWAASKAFHASFKPKKLKSLSGPPRLQLETTEEMLRVALYFARQTGLQGSALNGCGASGDRLQSQRRLVTKLPPNLVQQSHLANLLAS